MACVIEGTAASGYGDRIITICELGSDAVE